MNQKITFAPTVAEQKPTLTVWRNPNLSPSQIIQRNYHFWEKKRDEIARLYEQKNEAYSRALDEMKRISRQYTEIVAKCRQAEEKYFQLKLNRMEVSHE